MAGSALAQASPSAVPVEPKPEARRFGDFLVVPPTSSERLGGYGPQLSISFRSRKYRPFGSWEVGGVRPIKALSEGQPMLLAVTSGYSGVGTLLISVQNGVPLSRLLSPINDLKHPDWGVPQPGREEVLLFRESGRALDTNTGEVLWFDTRYKAKVYSSGGTLMSVSPDNRLAAFLNFKQILVGGREDGLNAAYQLPADANVGELADIHHAAYAQAVQAHKDGLPGIDNKRLAQDMTIAWFATRFHWQAKNGSWELVGRGLGPALPLSER
ncbi:hypothetical protein HKK52_11820 [Pseudomonas sp. ADAK2]|nr:hypothetical protein HKK53_11820 [Pseudomonas sp. ADAK7]QJI51869.1 hypothetical protein HKK52_11820 [Pseudomonas sp. ADAK2]